MGRLSLVMVALAMVHGSAGADPIAAAPAAPVRVAVVPGIAVNLDAARVDALSDDLAQALSAELVIDAVGGLEVRRQLPPEGLPPDCVTTPSCAADVARRTGATQLLFVVMVDSGAGGSIQIDATWIEPGSGHTASRPAIDLSSTADAEAKAKFATAAHLMLPDAPVRPKPRSNFSVDSKLTSGTPRHLTTPALITAGATVVGLGFGIGFGLQARSSYNACNTDPRCFKDDPRRDTIRHEGLAADAGFLVALGAGIATVVLYSTSSESPHVVVTPTPEGLAVAAIGSF